MARVAKLQWPPDLLDFKPTCFNETLPNEPRSGTPTVYSVQVYPLSLVIVKLAVCSVLCIVCIVHSAFTVLSYCSISSVHCSLYSLQCIVCNRNLECSGIVQFTVKQDPKDEKDEKD